MIIGLQSLAVLGSTMKAGELVKIGCLTPLFSRVLNSTKQWHKRSLEESSTVGSAFVRLRPGRDTVDED